MSQAQDLGALIDRAARGDDRPLWDALARGSRLPGPQPNEELVASFAEICAGRGLAPPIDRLVVRMATFDPDFAQGNTAFEILPMCGVAAAGARAAAMSRAGNKKVRDQLAAALHDAAEDLRFRVRDQVPRALAVLGAAEGEALLDDLRAAGWLEGYFHAAAVLLALAMPGWLGTLPNAEPVLAVVDEAFLLAKDAPRAASRYPGFKALVDALNAVPSQLTARYGVAVLEMLARWATSKDPAMRAIVDRNLRPTRVRSRFADDVRRVERALAGSAPVPRDPTIIVHGTRGRGKKHKAR